VATIPQGANAAVRRTGSGSAIAQRMVVKTSVRDWKFTQFKNYVKTHQKRDNETWGDYEIRLKGDFDHFDPEKQTTFLTNAIAFLKRQQLGAVKPKSPPKKPAIWSQPYVYKDGHWRSAKIQEMGGDKKPRRTTCDHVEQDLYSRMWWGTEPVWIGFVQNEFPCEDFCIDYFKDLSRGVTVLGFVFSVQESGDYAGAHGFNRGDNATVYFYRGEMSYQAPDGVGAPSPPP
jgi:hypothetical protein